MPDKEEVIGHLTRWRVDPVSFVREAFEAEPDAWQLDVLRAFPTSPRLAMVACAGPGKAQPSDLRLETPDGERCFGDLKIGDWVFGGDGKPTRVTGVFERGVLPVYRVSFDDGSATLACGEHIWKVRARAERARKYSEAYNRSTAASEVWSLLTTEQIIRRGVRIPKGKFALRQFEIPRQGAVEYPATVQPVDAYVLGVWLGDGVRNSGRYATKPTAEIEDEIRRRGYETSGARDGIVQVYGLATELRRLGLFRLYSHQRYVPPLFKRASAQQRRDMLCGLMDTDGEIADDGHMQFSSTSLELAEDVQWLARSLGGVAYQTKPKKPFYYSPSGEKIAGRTCYRVTLNLPFNPFRVPHRKERWKDPYRSPKSVRYMTRKLDGIEPAGEAVCRCIQVEAEDGLYLTNDFIVTHNTAVLAWIGWNLLLTRPYSFGGATSISGQNLYANLWPELSRWYAKSKVLQGIFEMTRAAIFARSAPATWRLEARTWAKDATAEQIGNALSGLHGTYPFWLLDESGGMPESILPICESIFAGNPVEAHIVQAGNPIQRSGPLYRAAMRARDLWRVVRITGDPDDPDRSPRIPVEYAREQIRQYGQDNPYVRVRIFGEFPEGDFNSLIAPDEVEASFRRLYREHDISNSAKVLGVDVARFGDDASVVFPRQGLQGFKPLVYRNLDGIQGAGAVARKWVDWDVDACFIDASGGFGASWTDQLRMLGKSPIGVQFAGEAHDKSRYYNKRTEMYFDCVEWIKRGGALPACPELVAGLGETTYIFKGDRLLLEPKEDVKARIGYSPDHADALALTFAEPVQRASARGRPGVAISDYDPHAHWHRDPARTTEYDPAARWRS